MNKWENIRTNLEETACEDVNCIQVVHDKIEWQVSCEHIREPSGSTRGRQFLHQLSDYQLI
jgi:hypothetical protein